MSGTPTGHDSVAPLSSHMNQPELAAGNSSPQPSSRVLASKPQIETIPPCDSRVPTSQGRNRGMSRSSSVPSAMYLTPYRVNSDFYPGVFGGSHSLRPTRNSTSSVRHLTCFWWKEKRSCRFTDDECLYAHYDTGHYTEPPRQLIPGEPALAGRKLDRAMRTLAVAHRSSGSLSSLAGSRQGSRSATPNVDVTPPLISPLLPQYQDPDLVRVRNDNQFLKTLVDQSGKEKAVMVNTIENLQADNKEMRAQLELMNEMQEQWSNERKELQGRIELLERQCATTCNATHPFGTIGRARVNTEARCIGGLLDE